MTRWQYARYVFVLSGKAAYEASHTVHMIAVLIAGIVAAAAWAAGRAYDLPEGVLVVLPATAALVVLFIGAAFESQYAAYWREHIRVLELEGAVAELRNRLTTQGPEADREQQAHAQLSGLTRADLLTLKHISDCGQLTEAQVVDFCRRNGLEIVTPGALAARVSFLTRDYALGAWSVLPNMAAAVRKALSDSL